LEDEEEYIPLMVLY